MKKTLSIILCIALTFCLAGCGSRLNDNNTRIAKVAVNTLDKYIDGEISADEARDIINAEMENIDKSGDDFSYFSLDSAMLGASSRLIGGVNGVDVAKVTEHRNKIAELAGINKR